MHFILKYFCGMFRLGCYFWIGFWVFIALFSIPFFVVWRCVGLRSFHPASHPIFSFPKNAPPCVLCVYQSVCIRTTGESNNKIKIWCKPYLCVAINNEENRLGFYDGTPATLYAC